MPVDLRLGAIELIQQQAARAKNILNQFDMEKDKEWNWMEAKLAVREQDKA